VSKHAEEMLFVLNVGMKLMGVAGRDRRQW